MTKQTRRTFLKTAGAAIASTTILKECTGLAQAETKPTRHPNLVFVFADQWRAQATGYAGDPNARTPNIDRFSRESVNFTNTVSTCPVCSPYRASLITGQYPLTHGVFVNDVPLNNKSTTFAEALASAGYDTAYIGKWHIDGHGRKAFIPKERRKGFDYWRVMECTHDYNNSHYYADTPEMLKWDGYDAIAQTKDAVGYIRSRKNKEKPFALFLSWGPPHDPYNTAPEKYKRTFAPDKIVFRPNVPEKAKETNRQDLAGHYAHTAALDSCFGEVLEAVKAAGLEEDTIVVFTSDHGDMLGSQGFKKKQKPWDESIMVPFLLRYPDKLGRSAKEISLPFETPDIMPTMLGLCGVDVPSDVEGADLTDVIFDRSKRRAGAALIACYDPFHEWSRKIGGKEYRGIRTERFTYVRDLKGPWLLYDNREDPYQMKNLVNDENYRDLQASLDRQLTAKLEKLGDKFLSGEEYIREWNYGKTYLE